MIETKVKELLKEYNFLKVNKIKLKIHDSLYSFYEDYLDIHIELDYEKYYTAQLTDENISLDYIKTHIRELFLKEDLTNIKIFFEIENIKE